MPALIGEVPRLLTTAIRVTQGERDHLTKVAATRGMSISDLIREGLDATGTLPKEVNLT